MTELENVSAQLWLYKVFYLKLRRAAHRTDFISSAELLNALNRLFLEVKRIQATNGQTEASNAE